MLKIKKFVFGPFSENTYLVFDNESREALLLDPGNMDPYEDKIIASRINDLALNLKIIVVTHAHIDHFLGVKFLREKYKASFILPEKEIPLLQYARQQGAMFGINISEPPEPDGFITEETTVRIGESTGKFIPTPGHTPGEHCLYFEREKVLFSGDVLFKESIGRTDLWGGDHNTLLDSVSNRLYILPEDVRIYPGHGEETTIGDEKRSNPFIKA